MMIVCHRMLFGTIISNIGHLLGFGNFAIVMTVGNMGEHIPIFNIGICGTRTLYITI